MNEIKLTLKRKDYKNSNICQKKIKKLIFKQMKLLTNMLNNNIFSC